MPLIQTTNILLNKAMYFRKHAVSVSKKGIRYEISC